jgi:hypothetical protein
MISHTQPTQDYSQKDVEDSLPKESQTEQSRESQSNQEIHTQPETQEGHSLLIDSALPISQDEFSTQPDYQSQPDEIAVPVLSFGPAVEPDHKEDHEVNRQSKRQIEHDVPNDQEELKKQKIDDNDQHEIDIIREMEQH